MAILSREQLKSAFINGTIPSQQDFWDLIDSFLNRRDDHFFGFWQSGMKYCQGDVIIHGKELYMLQLPEDEDCPPEGEVTGSDPWPVSGGDAKSAANGCICSTIPPDEDPRWCPLELEVDDGDWGIIDLNGEVVVVYNLKAKVGIGTDNPKARLEVTDQQYGSIQVEPNLDSTTKPAVSLLKLEKDADKDQLAVTDRTDYQLGQKTEWMTTSVGYAFYRDTSAAVPSAGAYAAAGPKPPPPSQMPEAPVLLFITSHDSGHAQVSIGTDEPQGLFRAYQADRGETILNPGKVKGAGMLLVDNEPDGDGYFLLSGVSQTTAYLQTDAADGFRLRKGGEASELLEEDSPDMGESLVAVKGDGKVGIGTEEPKSKLEVMETGSGTIRLDLSHDNPAVSAINLRPVSAAPVTYHAFGVDDDAATFITNAPCGYVFKKGGEYGSYDNEVNINQGDKIVYIGDTGKVGIQTSDIPDDYDLDVNGQIRGLTLHLETNASKIEQTGDLSDKDVLEKFDKLNPILFKWKNNTNAAGEGEQIGFNAQNVFECFPELVKKSGSYKSVAYANFSAVLVQAIKDQQVLIKQLEQRICDLEEQLGGGGD